MVSVCFYFQVHQPYRLRKYNIFDIGNSHDYFDNDQNRKILKKVAHKCYIPTNEVLLNLLKQYPNFKIAYSLSGVVIEQFKEYAPEVLDSFKELLKTGRVELIQETYHHSLSSIFSEEEFRDQVRLHKELIKKEFNVTPTVFRNTELIFNNKIGALIDSMGFKGTMAEGADKILEWRSPNFLYHLAGNPKFKLLLKNYSLSDDIAFRFSDKGWKEHPLTVEKFVKWLNNANGNGEIINLFMDYETFGEHQWESTGIFEFLNHLPGKVFEHPDNDFITPSEAIRKLESKGEFSSEEVISWADVERDISAWVGNDIQRAAVEYLYELEKPIKDSKDKKLLDDWRKLQTSDHFYYMCTKYFNDGDVHKYFNPYDSPYNAFINFMNILNDIILRLEKKGKTLDSERINEFKLKIKGV